MSNKFRASWSILNPWAQGNWDRAVKNYFKLDPYISEAMAEGKNYHEEWEAEIAVTKALPKIMGGKKLKAPSPELKMVAQLEDWLDLVGVIDCYDEPIIYEFKTGRTSSEVYASSMQPAIYGVLATFNDLLVDRAEIYHYDQHNKKHDMSIVWLTDKLIKKAHEWVVTYASEMHHYLETNNLYDTLGGTNVKLD